MRATENCSIMRYIFFLSKRFIWSYGDSCHSTNLFRHETCCSYPARDVVRAHSHLFVPVYCLVHPHAACTDPPKRKDNHDTTVSSSSSGLVGILVPLEHPLKILEKEELVRKRITDVSESKRKSGSRATNNGNASRRCLDPIGTLHVHSKDIRKSPDAR